MKVMRISGLVTLVTILLFQSLGVASEQYWIKVNPTVTGRYTVDVDIQTNIMEPVLLAVNIGLVDQKPDDLFIGTSFIKVPITKGVGKATIDGTKDAAPSGMALPGGTYAVKAKFYPTWKENKEIAKDLGISDQIGAESNVHLRASGSIDQAFIDKAEGQKWVMMNVNVNMPWDQNVWKEKFGEFEEVAYLGDGNPKILKMYYFKSIDMTIMVNAYKNEIITYREGLDHK